MTFNGEGAPTQASLSGGKTTLAGTFIAEKTHSNPPEYTLVSVSSSRGGGSGGAGGRLGTAGGLGGERGNNSKQRPGRADKGVVKCTVILALNAIEPLLSPEEVTTVVAKRSSKSGSTNHVKMSADLHSATVPRVSASTVGVLDDRLGAESADRLVATSASPGHAGGRPSMLLSNDLLHGGRDSAATDPSGLSSSATPLMEPPDASTLPPASRTGSKQAPKSARNKSRVKPRVLGIRTPRAMGEAAAAEVFSRLALGVHKPWVATRTDSQLLTYLAQRGGEPQIASPSSPSEMQSSMQFSAQSSRRRRHQHHRDLFDSCLRQDTGTPDGRNRTPSPNPQRRETDTELRRRRPQFGSAANQASGSVSTACPNSSRRAGRTLAEMIEDIVVLPEDPVTDYLQKEKDAEDAKLLRNSGYGGAFDGIGQRGPAWAGASGGPKVRKGFF